MPDDPNLFDDSLLPDWMRDMDDDDASEGEPSGESQPGQPAGDALPWLEPDQPDAAGAEPGAPAADDDWLSAFGSAPEADLPDESSDEDLDWLSAVDDQPEDVPADEEPPAEPEMVPDWLSAADDQPEEQPADEEPPAEPGMIPDWLSEARPPEAEPPTPEEEDLTFEEWEQREQERLREEQKTPEERLLEEVPDWFDEVEAAGGPPEGEPPESPGEAEFMPGWALGLEDQDTEQAPDWFQDLDLSAEAVTRPVDMPEPGAPGDGPSGGDLPDWFAGMDLPLPGEADSGEELPLPDLGDLGDAGEEPAESGDVPDWLAAQEDAIAGPEDIPFPDLDLDQPPPDEPAARDVDAWLAEMPPAAEPEEAATEPEDFVERFEPLTPDEFTPAPVDEETPAWLRDMAEEGGAEFDESPFEAAPEAEAEEPAPVSVSEDDMDWLADLSEVEADEGAGMGAEEVVAPEETTEEAAGDALGTAPLDSQALDQLLGLYDDVDEFAGEPEPGAELDLEPTGAGALPALIDEDLGAGMVWDDDLGLPAEPAEPQAADLPDFEALFAGGEPGEALPEIDDQFAAAGDESARPPTPPPQPLAVEPEPEAGPELPEEPAAPGAQPEWVAELRPSDLPVTVKAGGAERSLRQKQLDELPDRVRAFREAALHDLGDADLAPAPESGPLAGVAGALPLVDAVFPPATRAPSVEGLVVTPEQQARAWRLQALMDAISADDEAEDAEAGEAAPARRRKSRLKPDRVLVALILLVGLLVPFATDALHLAADPPALAGDRLAVAGEVDALEPGDYVLFAFEYGPPSAGELDGLAEALLRDVLARGAVPLALSTDPLGAFHAGAVIEPLADDAALLAARGQQETALVPGEDYAALAYLPGEAVGVRSLRYAYSDSDGTPKRHPAFDTTLRGEATDLPISRVEADISLIAVIGGESEAVRTWAEQLESVDVPKVALVTAALEPLVAPYVHEDGYAGYLAGYRDAASYNQARNAASRAAYVMPGDLPLDLPNPESARWHSMALGLAVAAGVIALGMVVNSIRALGRRRRR